MFRSKFIGLFLATGIAACGVQDDEASTPLPPLAQSNISAVSSESISTRAVVLSDQPNVLILFFDDMRFDSFSYRGGPVDTPNIDALASESVQFNTAITSTGICSPSRAALFTGRWGHRTGVDDNVQLWHSQVFGLRPDDGGLLRRAKDAGYYVHFVGKWHIGNNGPVERGAEFDPSYSEKLVPRKRFYTPYETQSQVDRYNAGERDKNGEKNEYWTTLPGGYEDAPDYHKVKDGMAMIRSAAEQDKPFFGVVSFNQPHPAYRVPEPYASLYDPADVVLPVNHEASLANKPLGHRGVYWPWHDTGHMTEADWRQARAHYYGAISMVDDYIGDLVKTAKEAGVYDDLKIIFLGDQGSMIGEHGLFDKGPYAYDELMRMPLLIRDPDVDAKSVNHHVSMLDIAPTMAEWMDLQPDGAVDGRSLNALMKSPNGQGYAGPDGALYRFEWYVGSWFGIRAWRTHDLKYVFNAGDSVDELYDLKADPGEVTNLIDDPAYAERMQDLKIALEAELVRIEDPILETYQYFALNGPVPNGRYDEHIK